MVDVWQAVFSVELTLLAAYFALVVVGEPLVSEFVVEEVTPGKISVSVSTFSFAAIVDPVLPFSLTIDGTDGYSPFFS